MTTPGELALVTRELGDAMNAYRNSLHNAARDAQAAKYVDRETAAQAALRDAWVRDAAQRRDAALEAWLVAHGWAEPEQQQEQPLPPLPTLAERLAWRDSHPLPMYDYDGVPALGALGAVRGNRRPYYPRRGRR